MRNLVASKLVVRRGGHTLLDAVSVSLTGGEFVAVIGANGAGKSTLLSVMAGLLKPDTGTVNLDGKALREYRGSDLAKRRAYLPQNPRCEWPISVENLVALGLTPSLPAIGRMPADYVARIEAALATCDLLAHRRQQATTLSGGELSRAMLARAMVGDPDYMIVDEPTAGLDPRHAVDTVRRLRLLANQGKGIVASLHDLTLAARYATRIVAIHRGRIAADGPTRRTMTSALLRDLFDVAACVSGDGEGTLVDFLSPAC